MKGIAIKAYHIQFCTYMLENTSIHYNREFSKSHPQEHHKPPTESLMTISLEFVVDVFMADVNKLLEIDTSYICMNETQ